FGYNVVVTGGVVTANVNFENEPTTLAAGRMTGGGSVFTGPADTPAVGVRVTHGFEVQRNAADGPNNLEINLDGNQIHIDVLTNAICLDDPAIAPNPPNAPFDTLIGRGTGSYNGVAGYTIAFTFTDAGEPGTRDTARYLVWNDADGDGLMDNGETPVLSVST